MWKREEKWLGEELTTKILVALGMFSHYRTFIKEKLLMPVFIYFFLISYD